MREALRGVDLAVENLVSLAGAHQGRIRVGNLIDTGADLLFRMMRHVEAAYPQITVEPTEFDFPIQRPASPISRPRWP